jgi:hypothetical protein
MHREMRDISGDLRERADRLVRQMVAEQARFRAALTELEKEKAIQRQRLERAVQAVHGLVNVITVQHVLHRALNSAVTALDAQAETSKGPLQNEKDESASPSLKEAALGAPAPEAAPGAGLGVQPGLPVPLGRNP